MTSTNDRVEWLTDLVRLEILLWDRVDAALQRRHDLPLSSFETLYLISTAPGGTLRVGDLAQRLRITVGGTSKLADRIEAAGLIERVADPADRRVSRLVLTAAGTDLLATTVGTYSATVAESLDPVLSAADQRHLHDLVRRLLPALAPEGPATGGKIAPQARAAPENRSVETPGRL